MSETAVLPPITVTKEQALTLLRAAVAERGEDYVDPQALVPEGKAFALGCSYVAEGRPSCIVGCVLHAAGVPIDTLILLDQSGSPTFQRDLDQNGDLVGEPGAVIFLQKHGVDLEDGVSEILNKAQCEQDAGSTWGNALVAATTA